MAETMDRILLEIVTPERKVLAREVDEVVMPGQAGELGVLPGHTELLTILKPGRLVMRDGAATELYSVTGGFAEVGHHKVVVLADAAEAAKEIDVERAKAAKAKAEKQLSELEMTSEHFAAAEAALERATVRLEVVQLGMGR